MFLEVLIISVLTAFLTLFLNYCIGKPGSEKFSPYEIFSSYTVWLSKRRLKKVGLLYQYNDQYKESEERAQSKSQLITLKNDFKKIYYEAAEPFFTWERAVGMCPICFGVWVAFIVFNAWLVIRIIVFHPKVANDSLFWFITKDIINLLIVIVISHIIIRLLTKVI